MYSLCDVHVYTCMYIEYVTRSRALNTQEHLLHNMVYMYMRIYYAKQNDIYIVLLILSYTTRSQAYNSVIVLLILSYTTRSHMEAESLMPGTRGVSELF